MDKKIILFLKENKLTFIITGIVLVMALVAFRQFAMADTYEDLLTQKYTEQSESFKKQINDINKINDTRFKAQEQLLKEYDEKYRLINENYQIKLDEIASKQKKTQVKIVEEAKKDPTTLTNKVKDMWGIPVQ
jgi:ABC-type bacteriocin/lantibiotic exporter with double-glycine peptidase domain